MRRRIHLDEGTFYKNGFRKSFEKKYFFSKSKKGQKLITLFLTFHLDFFIFSFFISLIVIFFFLFSMGRNIKDMDYERELLMCSLLRFFANSLIAIIKNIKMSLCEGKKAEKSKRIIQRSK